MSIRRHCMVMSSREAVYVLYKGPCDWVHCVYLVLDQMDYYVNAMFTFRLPVTNRQVYFSQSCSAVGMFTAKMSHAS